MSNQMEENRKNIGTKNRSSKILRASKLIKHKKVYSVYLSFLWSPVYKQTNTRIINRTSNYIWLFNATDTG